ncbi:formate dehydrogenase accessory sulfurtransferase FdhD [Desulfosoma caldarium]|uniref:Sulfur carrier protein FdhD n=1 Tax=Desulfosoma caldarium TaxID=610254 RepID=A0A3N1VFK9_9BACT|nr:formate dehydrogenase accessory sulfurtransferase FdhD [Desulfosoma caldarium]ROR01665.1 FdhD protein [Desulfosoma caldarium]
MSPKPLGSLMSDVEKVASVPVFIYSPDGLCEQRVQWVIEETPVTLYINGKELVTLLCAGHHLDELAVGFAYAEGFLDNLEELHELRIDHEQGRIFLEVQGKDHLAFDLWNKRTISSGCGKGTVFYHALDALLARPMAQGPIFSARTVWERMEDLHGLSQTYKRTHGVHNCALADAEGIVVFRDDIGRHNAVDMLVGHSLLNELPLTDKMLVTTGRLTSEIVIKAAKVGLPCLVSRNTATTLAIRLAQDVNMTLIGYARAGKFTVYTGKQRLA